MTSARVMWSPVIQVTRSNSARGEMAWRWALAASCLLSVAVLAAFCGFTGPLGLRHAAGAQLNAPEGPIHIQVYPEDHAGPRMQATVLATGWELEADFGHAGNVLVDAEELALPAFLASAASSIDSLEFTAQPPNRRLIVIAAWGRTCPPPRPWPMSLFLGCNPSFSKAEARGSHVIAQVDTAGAVHLAVRHP